MSLLPKCICHRGSYCDPSYKGCMNRNLAPASPPSPATEGQYIFEHDGVFFPEMQPGSNKIYKLMPEMDQVIEGKELKTDLERRIENLEHDPLRTVYGPPPRDPEEDRKEILAFIESTKQMPEAKFVPTPPAGAEGEGEKKLVHPEDLKEVVRYIDEVLTDNLLIVCGALDGQYKIGGIVAASEYLANWFTGFWEAMDEGAEQWRSDFMDATEKLCAAHTKIAELEAKVKDLQDWIHSHC